MILIILASTLAVVTLISHVVYVNIARKKNIKLTYVSRHLAFFIGPFAILVIEKVPNNSTF